MCVSDTVSVTVSVVSLTPVASKITLLALADVEIEVAGAVFTLHGVQLRADGEHTKVTMPQYRDPGGAWKPALSLPEELKGPIGDAVIAAGLEAGILRGRLIT